MIHTCHAHNCTISVPPKMFMCKTHWFALSKQLQEAIWKEYKQGQEITKKPALRYLSVQQYAISSLVKNEEEKEIYKDKSMKYRELSIIDELGDPLEGIV